jgi:hypothetical protein
MFASCAQYFPFSSLPTVSNNRSKKAIAFATAVPCVPRLLRHRSSTHGHPRRRVAGPRFKLRPPNQYAPASDSERQSTKSIAITEIATGHNRAQPEAVDARGRQGAV